MTSTTKAVPYRRYRSRRWPFWAAAVVCVLAIVAGWQLWRVPWVSAVTPGQDAYVSSETPTVTLRIRNLQQLSDVRVVFAGHDVTASTTLDGDELTFAPPDKLADGTYDVRFSARASNLFRRHVVREWRFTVDTIDPTLEAGARLREGKINTDPAVFTGTTEPGAEVTAETGDLRAATTAAANGAFRLEMVLPEGPTSILLAATDKAGNTTSQTLSLYVDVSPPILAVVQIARTIDRNSLKLRISAEDGVRAPELIATLDDETLDLEGPASAARLKLTGLAEGRHSLVVTATDGGGNQTTETRAFTVDSTERFGAATLMFGARGDDVRELQRRLKQAGVFDGGRSGKFGVRTAEAVISFQEKYGLTADGVVGPRMLIALNGHIVVDLSELRLYLYRAGDLSKTYRIAAGSSKYPTQTGTFSVTSKVMDPTWYPPNSEWAKDAKPIPPGVTNPLGTRWIGTSAPNVGIHGTPDAGSIGTYASHGCIRMYISDVEQLFDKVALGMPVVIRP